MSNTFWWIVGITVLLAMGLVGLSNRELRETEIQAEYGDNAPYVSDWGDSYCTYDCSGHQAGYEHASEYGICDEEYDNGDSESFNEGVRQWAYEYC